MSNPTILYLLCGEAEYQCNAVHAAYTSQSDAERDAALLGAGFHVRPVPLDPDTSPLRNGQHVFNVRYRQDGTFHVSEGSASDFFFSGEVDAEAYHNTLCSVHVAASDREQALAQGMEMIRAHRAQGGDMALVLASEAEMRKAVRAEKERAAQEERLRKELTAAKGSFRWRNAGRIEELLERHRAETKELNALLEKESEAEQQRIREQAVRPAGQ